MGDERAQERKVESAPALVTKKGTLVHHGDGRAAVDIVEFIRSEREARSRRIAREGRK